MTTRRDNRTLRIAGYDPAKLTEAERRQALEIERRISQCGRVCGADKRRPKALADWRAFIAAHPDAFKS